MKMPEPKAWIRGSGLEMLKLENGGVATVFASNGMSNNSQPLYDKQALIDLLEAAANLSERLWPDEKRSGHEWTDGFADGTCGAADAIRSMKEKL